MNIKFIFSAIVVLLLYTGAVNAQVVLTAQEAVLSEQDKAYFDLHIKNQNYAVFTLDTSELLDSLRTHEYCNVQLYISEQWNWTFYLVPDKRWTGTGAVTCEGKTANNEPVIISIGKDFYGIVHSNKGDYLIRPIWLFTQNFDDKSLIAFKVSDL